MNNDQFVEAMVVAATLNTFVVIVGIVINNSRLGGLLTNIDTLFQKVDARFGAIDRRFDEMHNLCHTELRRFEDAIVVRIKRLEERS
jgi:hypothetical protein